MAMRTALMLSCMTLALMGCVGSNDDHRSPPTTEQVDLQRYQGTWYELARLPMFFQRISAPATRTTYGAARASATCATKPSPTMTGS